MDYPKVIKLVDLGCVELALLSDGNAILQPKTACSVRQDPKQVQESLAEIGPKIKETIYVSKPLFKLKEGVEVPIEA